MGVSTDVTPTGRRERWEFTEKEETADERIHPDPGSDS